MLSEKVLNRRAWKPKLYEKLTKNSILKVLVPYIPRDKIVLDVGGNTGYHCHFFSEHAKHVYTYEPVPELHTVQKSNMTNKNISFRNMAVGNKVTSIDLYVDVRRLSMTSQIPLVESEKISVPMTRLDSEHHQNIGFIKIDVEGFELDVLRGAQQLITTQTPNCMVEIYKPWADKTGGSVREVFEWFDDKPYSCFYYDSEKQYLVEVTSIDHGEEVVNTLHHLHDGDFLFLGE